MKTEPSLNRPMLVTRVQELYRLPVQSLTFVAEGECAVAYVVHCAGGERRFLKLWPAGRLGSRLSSRLGFVLAASRALYRHGLVVNQAYPIPTQSGELRGAFGDYTLALFPFVDGQPLASFGDHLPPSVTRQIAETFARLHHATSWLTDHHMLTGLGSLYEPHKTTPIQVADGPVVQLPSPFNYSFADDFAGALQALADVRPTDRPGLVALRELLLPRQEELRAWLDKTVTLAHQAAERRPKLVLCHTDMGGNNVLVDGAGQVVILDWDELTLAPIEHDLHEYRDGGSAAFAAFLESYFAAGGLRDLDPLQFEFYLLRRYLADLTDWMIRIIRENTDLEQDAHDLEGIKEYALARLDCFEAEMAELRRALNSQ